MILVIYSCSSPGYAVPQTFGLTSQTVMSKDGGDGPLQQLSQCTFPTSQCVNGQLDVRSASDFQLDLQMRSIKQQIEVFPFIFFQLHSIYFYVFKYIMILKMLLATQMGLMNALI